MNRFYIILILIIWAGCSTENTNSKYLRWIGDSEFNTETDRQDFQLCSGENRVKQYFHFGKGLQYEGEKKKLVRQFTENYKPVNIEQSGWVRIRFIVNCNGETGRFRMNCSDENFIEQEFDTRITDQLLSLTKGLDDWEILSSHDKPRDYYQYLVFKIRNGNIIEIMP